MDASPTNGPLAPGHSTSTNVNTTTNLKAATPALHPGVLAAPTTYAQQQHSKLMRIAPFDVNSSEMLRAIMIAMKAIRPDASTASEIRDAVEEALLSYQMTSDVYNAYEDGSCYTPRCPEGGFEDPRTPTAKNADVPPPPPHGGTHAMNSSTGSTSDGLVDKVARFPFLVPGGIVELVDYILEAIGEQYSGDDAPIAISSSSSMTQLAATAMMVCEEARQHWKRAHVNVIRDLLPFLRTAQAVVVLGSGQLLGKILARGVMESVRFYILEGSPELPAERMRRKERDRDRRWLSGASRPLAPEEDEDDFDGDHTIGNETMTYRGNLPTARGDSDGNAVHATSPFVPGWSEDYVVRGRGSGVNLLNEVQFQAAKLCGLLPKKGEKMSVDAQERLEVVMARVSKSCVIVSDSLMASALGMSDFGLVGAYGVTESGGIVHRSGSYQLALLSKALNKPLYVACESFKFTRETHCFPSASFDIAQPQSLQENEEQAVLSTNFCHMMSRGGGGDSTPHVSTETTMKASLGRTLGVQPSTAVTEQLRTMRRGLSNTTIGTPPVAASPVKQLTSPVAVAPPAAASATVAAPKPNVRRGKNNTAAPSFKVDLTGEAAPQKSAQGQKKPLSLGGLNDDAATLHDDDACSEVSEVAPPQSPTMRKFKSFHSSSVHMIDRLEDEALAATEKSSPNSSIKPAHHHMDPNATGGSGSAPRGTGKSSSMGGTAKSGGGMGPRSISHSNFTFTDTTNRRAAPPTTASNQSGGGVGGLNSRGGVVGGSSSFRGGFAVPQSPFMHSSASKSDLSSLGGGGGVSGMFPNTPASGMQGVFPTSSGEFFESFGKGGGGGTRSDNSPETAGRPHYSNSNGSPNSVNKINIVDGEERGGTVPSTPAAAEADPFFAFAQPWDSAQRAPPPMLELVPSHLLTLFFTDKALMPPAGIVHHFYNVSGSHKWWQDAIRPAKAE